MTDRLHVLYHIRSDAERIEARATSIAVEQSVEMPLSAITDSHVLDHIVGKVMDINDLGDGTFGVRIGLAPSTTGLEPGQLVNMLFGNASIYDDVSLVDVDFTADVLAALPGPGPGLAGLRPQTSHKQALTGSALKPLGLATPSLARLAAALAEGGLDFIKDDHGLADQASSPFAQRIPACAQAIRSANPATRYIPSVTGHLDRMRNQIKIAQDHGVDAVMVAPMISGLPSLEQLRREYPQMAFFAHPALAGSPRIAPPLLLGKLFRLLGADATIFPNYGGRFGYSQAICRDLAQAATGNWVDKAPTLPVPAGGMNTERVEEMLAFYGHDVMLLIGGALLDAKDQMTAATRAFTDKVRQFHG